MIDSRARDAGRWHVRCTLPILACMMIACGGRRPAVPLDPPSEAARHRAALAGIIVANATTDSLVVAFESATPPIQKVTIGRVPAGTTARLAPVPAGEPLILSARRADGGEYRLPARSFAPDAEWTWEIPRSAPFTRPQID